MSSSGHSRNVKLDALKGFAILLVVLGHSIQGAIPDFAGNPLYLFIYSFHMPLFMFLAGAVAFLSFRADGWEDISKKAKALLVPYFSWFGASLLIAALVGAVLHAGNSHIDGPGSLIALLLEPANGLWFLYTLFWCFLCLMLILKTTGISRGWMWAMLPLALFIVPINAFGLWEIRWYLPFFLMGYLISKNWPEVNKHRRGLFAMSLVAFPVLLSQYVFIGPTPLVVELYGSLEPWGAPRAVLTVLDLGFRAALALSGIMLVGTVVMALTATPVGHPLAILGTFSMDIYVSHQLVLSFFDLTGILGVLVSFVAALALSLALSVLVLRRSSYLSRAFLGVSRARFLSMRKTRA